MSVSDAQSRAFAHMATKEESRHLIVDVGSPDSKGDIVLSYQHEDGTDTAMIITSTWKHFWKPKIGQYLVKYEGGTFGVLKGDK